MSSYGLTDAAGVDSAVRRVDLTECVDGAHVHRVPQIITKRIAIVNRKPPTHGCFAVRLVWTHRPVISRTTQQQWSRTRVRQLNRVTFLDFERKTNIKTLKKDSRVQILRPVNQFGS